MFRVVCMAAGFATFACQTSYPFGPALHPGPDAGVDAGVDAGILPGGDAGRDAGEDAGADAGQDEDGGLVDAGWCPGTDCVCNGYELCNWTDDTFQCEVDDLWTHTVIPPDAPGSSQYEVFCPGSLPRWHATGECLVTDTVTGLIWQQTPSTGVFTAAEAPIHCAGLSYGGFDSGWRLPSVVELSSLVDLNADPPIPAIDGNAFPNTPAVQFWTSTPYPAAYTWYVDFATGSANYITLVAPMFPVRCVRGG